MIPFIIKNSSIPKISSWFISVYAITLWPFVFIKDCGNEITIHHEKIHIKQQAELLLLFFYLIYIFDWLHGLIKYRSFQKAYYKIRFEQEAFENESDIYYLVERRRYSWLKYKV